MYPTQSYSQNNYPLILVKSAYGPSWLIVLTTKSEVFMGKSQTKDLPLLIGQYSKAEV